MSQPRIRDRFRVKEMATIEIQDYPVLDDGTRRDIFDVVPFFLDGRGYRDQFLRHTSILPPEEQPCKTAAKVARILYAHKYLQVWAAYNEKLLARLVNRRVNSRKQPYPVLRLGRWEQKTEKENISWLVLWPTSPPGFLQPTVQDHKPGIMIQVQRDGRLTHPMLLWSTRRFAHQTALQESAPGVTLVVDEKKMARYNYKSLVHNWLQQGYADPNETVCEVFLTNHLENGLDALKRETDIPL